MAGWFDNSRNLPPWVIVPTASPLPNGDTGYEVEGKDIPSYNRPDFWLAVKYWKKYKKFGLPRDWDKMTVQQLAVIVLFDDLLEAEKRRKDGNADR